MCKPRSTVSKALREATARFTVNKVPREARAHLIGTLEVQARRITTHSTISLPSLHCRMRVGASHRRTIVQLPATYRPTTSVLRPPNYQPIKTDSATPSPATPHCSRRYKLDKLRRSLTTKSGTVDKVTTHHAARRPLSTRCTRCTAFRQTSRTRASSPSMPCPGIRPRARQAPNLQFQ
jgi:hypothetical protein